MTLERSHCFSEQWRVTEYIKKHPYLSSALICLFIEFFTFGDQMYIGAQTILLTMAGLSATLIILLRNKIKHFNYFIPAIIAAFFSVGAMISGSTRKGPAVCFAIILSTVLIILFLYEKKEITPEKLNALVLFASLGICTAYVLYTYSTFRQTDVGGWDAPVGHAGYVKYFVEHNMCLPDFDPRTRSQFYHTPLYYFTSALLTRILMSFGINMVQSAEISQVVSLYSVFCIIISSCKIFRHFNLKGYSFTVALTIVSMCNAIAIISGSVSNDAMSTALEIGALLCALNWYESNKISDILKSSVCLGAGVMTKLSAWMAAPAIAFLFILVFINTIRRKNVKQIFRLIGQYIVFIFVCAPLALWYPIYNNIRYGIPLGYVPEGTYETNSYPVLTRLFTIGPKAFTSPIVTPLTFSDEYNPFFTLFKSSLDLQRFSKYNSLIPVLTLSLIVTVILGLTGFAAMIFSLFVKNKSIPVYKNISLIIFYFTIIISFSIFCINYPFIVTENIRYIYAIVMIGALYTGKVISFPFKNERFGSAIKKLYGLITSFYAFCFIATFGFLGFIQ